MISIILLVDSNNYVREQMEEAPELLERAGRIYSLRAGPRQPQPTDHPWDCVAVYAGDELTEEEFQSLYWASRERVTELGLKY